MPIINYEEGERENANGHVKRDGVLLNTDCTDFTDSSSGDFEGDGCLLNTDCADFLDSSSGGFGEVDSGGALVALQEELKWLGLWKFAGAVMYVLHETLGLSDEKMIAPMDEKRGKLLLAEILNGGNFGRHFTKYGHFTQQGMAKKYFLKIWRNMHFVRYYPAESLSEPIFRTWHFFWRLKYRR